MTSSPRSEREALRALLKDGLLELRQAPDPERAADDILRTLDAYIDHHPTAVEPSERPVTDYEARQGREARTITWVIVGSVVIATGVVAVALGGGWPSAITVLAIWVGGLIALTST